MRAKLFKVDLRSTIRKNKLITQGEKLETSAKLRVFVSNISSFCFVVRVRWTACVQRKFECVSCSYYKLELNLYSHCFDLTDINLNKHFNA